MFITVRGLSKQNTCSGCYSNTINIELLGVQLWEIIAVTGYILFTQTSWMGRFQSYNIQCGISKRGKSTMGYH